MREGANPRKIDTSPDALTPSPSPIRWARVASVSLPFEAEREKASKRSSTK